MKSKITLLFAATLLLAQATPLMAGCCWGGSDAQEEAAPAQEAVQEAVQEAAQEVAEVVTETLEVETPAAETETAE